MLYGLTARTASVSTLSSCEVVFPIMRVGASFTSMSSGTSPEPPALYRVLAVIDSVMPWRATGPAAACLRVDASHDARSTSDTFAVALSRTDAASALYTLVNVSASVVCVIAAGVTAAAAVAVAPCQLVHHLCHAALSRAPNRRRCCGSGAAASQRLRRLCSLRHRFRSSQVSIHATPRHATPRHATPRHATPRHATPRHAAPRHATHSFCVEP